MDVFVIDFFFLGEESIWIVVSFVVEMTWLNSAFQNGRKKQSPYLMV